MNRKKWLAYILAVCIVGTLSFNVHAAEEVQTGSQGEPPQIGGFTFAPDNTPTPTPAPAPAQAPAQNTTPEPPQIGGFTFAPDNTPTPTPAPAQTPVPAQNTIPAQSIDNQVSTPEIKTYSSPEEEERTVIHPTEVIKAPEPKTQETKNGNEADKEETADNNKTKPVAEEVSLQGKEEKVTEVHEHAWTRGAVTKYATRTEEGEKTYYCTECGEKKVEKIPVLACQHTASKSQVTVRVATANQSGLVNFICNDCGAVVKTLEVHAHDTHQVDVGNNQTAEVKGYFDTDAAQKVFAELNAYRKANGLNELEWNNSINDVAITRLTEAAYTFTNTGKLTHTRPNGEYGSGSLTSGATLENLAAYCSSPEVAMAAWKQSAAHNKNMLNASHTYVSIMAFNAYVYKDGYDYPQKVTMYIQVFG